MDHEAVLRTILDRGWHRADLETAVTILAHIYQCPDCNKALSDYDRIRTTLGCSDSRRDEAGNV